MFVKIVFECIHLKVTVSGLSKQANKQSCSCDHVHSSQSSEVAELLYGGITWRLNYVKKVTNIRYILFQGLSLLAVVHF